MGIDISGVTINSDANGITATNNSQTLAMRNNGIVLMPGQSMFSAGSSTAAWQYGPAATWVVTSWNVTANNVGSCWNGSNTFTAPITGTYYFTANAYALWGVATTDFSYPCFSVNGSTAGRRNGQTNYRVRHYGLPAAGYSGDVQIQEMYYLYAGDTVQFIIYQQTATCAWYPAYGQFDGIFLG